MNFMYLSLLRRLERNNRGRQVFWRTLSWSKVFCLVTMRSPRPLQLQVSYEVSSYLGKILIDMLQGHATPPQAADTSNISYFSTQKQPTNPVHATSSISEFTLAKDIPKSSASTTSKSSSRPRPKPAWKKAEQDKENQSPSDVVPSIAERAKMRSQMRTSSSMISDTASFAAGTAPIDRTSSPPLGLAAGGILQETLGKPAAPILVDPTPLSNVPETPQEKAEKPKKKRKASDPGDEGKKKKKKKSSADTIPSKVSEVPTYKSNEFISSSQAEEDVPLPPAVIAPQFEIPPSPPPLVPPAHDDELNIRDKDRPVSWNTLAPPKHLKEGESGTKPPSKPVGPKSSSSKAVPKRKFLFHIG